MCVLVGGLWRAQPAPARSHPAKSPPSWWGLVSPTLGGSDDADPSSLHTLAEVNSRWTADLTVTGETTKPLEEKAGAHPHGLGIRKEFLNKTQKALP